MKRIGVTAVVLVVLMTAAFTGMASAAQSVNAGGSNGGHNGDRPDNPGTFFLNQSINFGERVVADDDKSYGIFMDGSLFEVDTAYTNPNFPTEVHDMFSENVVVQADWSDNLILHDWRAGDKIRTEVILQDILDPSITIYTICASFKIELLSATGEVADEIWAGTTYDGLWVDGPTDAYSAEVNQLGNLLYGYNWDTKDLPAGQYRLTFELIGCELVTYPGTETPIQYNSITIDGMVDPGMYGADDNYALDAAEYGATYTMIEISLLEK
ncbi:MAG: hypothetical protein KKE24_05595 [Candidatus Thermoplasmatota archaeon]|nr:hypothetical protein [Candidatus Thermoplasmatota archaeon]